MPFLKPREKTVSHRQLRAFWEDYVAGGRVRKKITPYYRRTVVSITPSSIGTVRRFSSREHLIKYKKNTRIIEKAAAEFEPKRFEVQPVQFFGQKGQSLIERVYTGPNLFEVINLFKEGNRYFPFLVRRLKRRKIDFKP